MNSGTNSESFHQLTVSFWFHMVLVLRTLAGWFCWIWVGLFLLRGTGRAQISGDDQLLAPKCTVINLWVQFLGTWTIICQPILSQHWLFLGVLHSIVQGCSAGTTIAATMVIQNCIPPKMYRYGSYIAIHCHPWSYIIIPSSLSKRRCFFEFILIHGILRRLSLKQKKNHLPCHLSVKTNGTTPRSWWTSRCRPARPATSAKPSTWSSSDRAPPSFTSPRGLPFWCGMCHMAPCSWCSLNSSRSSLRHTWNLWESWIKFWWIRGVVSEVDISLSFTDRSSNRSGLCLMDNFLSIQLKRTL